MKNIMIRNNIRKKPKKKKLRNNNLSRYMLHPDTVENG